MNLMARAADTNARRTQFARTTLISVATVLTN